MDMNIVGLALAAVNFLLLLYVCVFRKGSNPQEDLAALVRSEVQQVREQMQKELQELRQDSAESMHNISQANLAAINQLSEMLQRSISQQLEQMRTNAAQESVQMRTQAAQQTEQMRQQMAQQAEQLRGQLAEQNKAVEGRLTHLEEMNDGKLEKIQRTLSENLIRLRDDSSKQLASIQQSMTDNLSTLRNDNTQQLDKIQKSMTDNLSTLRNDNTQQLDKIQKSMADSMQQMLSENSQQLDKIRGTVDEKLQTTLEKRISESFKTVSTQLEQVYKGLGEMQNLAQDVGSLKKVMSGVKTRGNLGEYQLNAILEEILAPEQYATNVATVPHSTERVEFAIKLPHEDGTVYLPIDSKFPADTYEKLRDAQESGDRKAVEDAYKALESVIRSEAKSIKTKYVAPPYTTNFAIMFLPTEGLYAEVVSRGMVESLQRDYQVNVAGPSTMAALLNSLQMGFKTLAIQKKSSHAWEVLGAVKTEFGKYGDSLAKMQKYLSSTSKELDSLITTRTNVMNRKLQEVEKLDDAAAQKILQIDER